MPRPKYTATVTNNQGKVIREQTFDWFGAVADFVVDLRYDQTIALKDVKRIVIDIKRSKK